MDEAELGEFLNGSVPDTAECRDVAYAQLRPGECDEQTSYGTPAGRLYCGAPKTTGFSRCRFHLFDALNSGVPADQLRE